VIVNCFNAIMNNFIPFFPLWGIEGSVFHSGSRWS
jgi:hypothetical protein